MNMTACAAVALTLALVLTGCGGPSSPSKPSSSGPMAEAKPPAQTAPVQVAKDDKAQQEKVRKEKEEAAAELAKLSPEDRKLAEAQGYCAVEDDNRLGAMGTPIKVMVKGEPVFVCCGGCKKDALADPDKTLAKVKQLQAKVKAEAGK